MVSEESFECGDWRGGSDAGQEEWAFEAWMVRCLVVLWCRDDAKFLQFVTVFANSCGFQPSTGTAAIHIIAAVQ